MLDNKRILDFFRLFSDIPDEDLENWKFLCENASLQLQKYLKDNLDISKHMDRLCTTAAALAYCDYILLDNKSSSIVGDIKVGDISVKNSDSNTSVNTDSSDIKNYFLGEIQDLLKDYPAFIVPVVSKTEKYK